MLNRLWVGLELLAYQSPAAGVAVASAVIQQDNDFTVAFSGKNISFRKTLSGGVHAPAKSDPFLAAVKATERQAHQHEAAEAK